MTITPMLKYVGRVETLDEDWPALVSKFFTATAGAQVQQLLRNDQLRERDHQDGDGYADTVDPKFDVEITSKEAKEAFYRAFVFDEVCFGYRDSLQRLSQPKVPPCKRRLGQGAEMCRYGDGSPH